MFAEDYFFLLKHLSGNTQLDNVVILERYIKRKSGRHTGEHKSYIFNTHIIRRIVVTWFQSDNQIAGRVFLVNGSAACKKLIHGKNAVIHHSITDIVIAILQTYTQLIPGVGYQ